MSKSEIKELLPEVLIFRDLEPEEIDEIGEVALEEVFVANETVFSEGDPGDALYVVGSGQVRICRCTSTGIEKVLSRLGPKSVFGEMSILDGMPRSASAVADSDCTLVKIARSDIEKLIDNNSIAAYKVIYAFSRTLSYRLRKMNDELIELFSEPEKTVGDVLREKDGEDYLLGHE